MHDVRPVGDDVVEAIEALPADFLVASAELRVALEVSPSSVGGPYEASGRRLDDLWG